MILLLFLGFDFFGCEAGGIWTRAWCTERWSPKHWTAREVRRNPAPSDPTGQGLDLYKNGGRWNTPQGTIDVDFSFLGRKRSSKTTWHSPELDSAPCSWTSLKDEQDSYASQEACRSQIPGQPPNKAPGLAPSGAYSQSNIHPGSASGMPCSSLGWHRCWLHSISILCFQPMG